MKFLPYLILFTSTIAVSQINNDSISIKKIKEEIKAELREEIKNENKSLFNWSNFSLKGYGVVNYYNYDYDTDPNLKDKFDAERLNLYLEYKFTNKINFKSEIEFEHGGTGSTLELDVFEEAGEFEQEVEKGGEVKVEQVHINFQIQPYFNIRAGRMKVYFGLHQNLDMPTRYFTTNRQEMENEILPLGWYENGIEIYGTFAKRINYKFYVVNGLDATGFSSRGFIKGGYQQRFELTTGESFAFAGRLDYKFGTHKDTYFGVAAYVNDAAANRPKNDMKESAYVTLVEGHITYNEKNLRFNAIALFGNIENSNIVSQKNANLSNNLGVKRTPVGKNALGYSIEVGCNVMNFIKKESAQMLYPFLRYDYYDTMKKVEGNVVDNPRWERSVITGGFNWFVHPQIVIKAQYSNRTLGSENYNQATLQFTGKKQQENTFSAGIGFAF
jgi:Phosphate-selective porin O and P